jgi:hypothetical protein
MAMEAVRKLKANLKLDGKPCGWCNDALHAGEDAAVCTACETAHHDRCWEGKAGCGTAGCVNAPLQRLDAPLPGGAPVPPALQPLPPGLMRCPRCGNTLAIGVQICGICRAITSPDGLYTGPKVRASGAVASMVCGIVGVLFCGIVLGIIAIALAGKAKRMIATDPMYGGGGFATAGLVLGVLAICSHILGLMMMMGRH